MFDLQLNPPFRFSPCYLLADFSAQNFNQSTVIFYFFCAEGEIILIENQRLRK
jgi:hypothetical protein